MNELHEIILIVGAIASIIVVTAFSLAERDRKKQNQNR